MNRCHLCFLLGLLELAVVHETKTKLQEDEGKHEDTNHLVRRIEFLGL